jgi:hypothetical protein
MELRYNASQFTPGCTAEHARDFCSPCSTVIDHHHIICYDCFNQSFATLPNATDYAQVLLRVPSTNSNFLRLPIPSGGAAFNVYVRLGGISNPLLYDFKFLGVSESAIELPSLNYGDLIGIYVDWNDYSYDASLGIKIVSGETTPPVSPPFTPPVTPVTPVTPPVAPPVTSPATPLASPPVTVVVPVSEPISQSPPNAPVASPPLEIDPPISWTPVSQPVTIYYPPVYSGPTVAIPPAEAPIQITPPLGNQPQSNPPVSQPVATPITFEPVTVPVAAPVNGPIQGPDFGSAVAAQSPSEDNVSSGVRFQLGLIFTSCMVFLAC